MCSKGNHKKRKQSALVLPDGSGWGDHIQLLQVFESWDRAGYSPDWCIDNDIQVLPPLTLIWVLSLVP